MSLFRVKAKTDNDQAAVVGGGSDLGYLVFHPASEDPNQRYPLVNDVAHRIALDRQMVDLDISRDDLNKELVDAGFEPNPEEEEGQLVGGPIMGPGSAQFDQAVQQATSQALAALGITSDTLELLKRLDVTSQIDGNSGALDTLATTAHRNDPFSGHDGSGLGAAPAAEDQDGDKDPTAAPITPAADDKPKPPAKQPARGS